MNNILMAVLLFCFLMLSSLAGQGKWVIDKSHSTIGFSVEHVVLSGDADSAGYVLGVTEGRFSDFELKFKPGDADFSNSSITVKNVAGSIDTGHNLRDGHLRARSFFHTDKYPYIHFKSTSFIRTTPKSYRITGTITIRGVSKPLVLTATFNGDPEKLGTAMYASFTVEGTLRRGDFDLDWDLSINPGGFRIANDVSLKMQLNLRKLTAKP